jgi:hypothetical protein
VQLVFTPSIEGDECAFLQKAARRGGTNARTGSRNDDYFTFKSTHDFSPTLNEAA